MIKDQNGIRSKLFKIYVRMEDSSFVHESSQRHRVVVVQM